MDEAADTSATGADDSSRVNEGVTSIAQAGGSSDAPAAVEEQLADVAGLIAEARDLAKACDALRAEMGVVPRSVAVSAHVKAKSVRGFSSFIKRVAKLCGKIERLEGSVSIGGDATAQIEGERNNLRGLQLELDTVRRAPGLVALSRTFPLDGGGPRSRQEVDCIASHGHGERAATPRCSAFRPLNESFDARITVCVMFPVCCVAWVEVKCLSRQVKASDRSWASAGGIRAQMERIVRCAAQNKVGWCAPVVVARFLNGVDAEALAELTAMGVRVWPSTVDVDDGSSSSWEHPLASGGAGGGVAEHMPHTMLHAAVIPRGVFPRVRRVRRAALDTTTLATICSDVLHGDAVDTPRVWEWATQQEQWRSAVLDERARRSIACGGAEVDENLVTHSVVKKYMTQVDSGEHDDSDDDAADAAAGRFEIPKDLDVPPGGLLEELLHFLSDMHEVVVCETVVAAIENIISIVANKSEERRWKEQWKPVLRTIPDATVPLVCDRSAHVKDKHCVIFG